MKDVSFYLKFIEANIFDIVKKHFPSFIQSSWINNIKPVLCSNEFSEVIRKKDTDDKLSKIYTDMVEELMDKYDQN